MAIYVKPEFHFKELIFQKFEYFKKSLVGITQLNPIGQINSGSRRDE
jgi:hypothetical protein